MASFCWVNVPIAAVEIWLAFGLGRLTAAQQASPPSAEVILQQALIHADWFNWADSVAEFQQAERLFTNQHDRRNALYAKVGILRATMEDHSLVEVRKERVQIA